MATVFSGIVPIRRVAVGTSATAQGLDGVSELTRTALESLLAAPWTVSTDAPSFPVHDYDRPLPSGDAWKACYGYDASARTERGAAGAVCYTFPIPADALTGAACNVSALAFNVVGDRYLDAGVDVHVVLDANAAPPSVATLAARTPDATVCATSSQTEPPNQRHGVTAAVELEPGTAATAYLHVALLLHDYLTARGAWIEGGAMLADGEVSITFSRDVAASPPVEVSLLLGSLPSGSDEDDWVRHGSVPGPHCRGSAWYCIYDSPAEESIRTLAQFSNPQAEALNLVLAPTVSTATAHMLAGQDVSACDFTALNSGDLGKVAYSYPGDTILAPGVAWVLRSGFVPAGRYAALSLSALGSAAGLPIRVVAYLANAPVYSCAPDAASLGSPAFWAGRATSVEIVTKFNGSSLRMWASPNCAAGKKPDIATATVPVTPLCAFDVAQGANIGGSHPFAAPVEIGDVGHPVTVLVAFAPAIGGSSNTATVTIPRTLSASLVLQ